MGPGDRRRRDEMTSARDLDDDAIDRLTRHAASWTGFSPDAIQPESIRRAARAAIAAGTPLDELVRLAERRDPEVVSSFFKVVSVGETYFYRHPEHFHFISAEAVPRRL